MIGYSIVNRVVSSGHLCWSLKQMKKLHYLFLFTALLFVLAGCNKGPSGKNGDELSISFKKYELKNGLQVILHQDHSDPIVSLAVLYHVGSNREKPGKTGFAHLFEHMLFQQSEHIGEDQFFKIIQDAGGTLNGGTFEDGTIYYEVAPKNALELILWMESDQTLFYDRTSHREKRGFGWHHLSSKKYSENWKRDRWRKKSKCHHLSLYAKTSYPLSMGKTGGYRRSSKKDGLLEI